MRNWVVLALVAVGCGEEFAPSEYDAAQLARATVTLDDDDTTITLRRDWAGLLDVDGDSGNFEINVNDGLARVAGFTVYVPSETDLNEFQGRQAQVTVAPDPGSNELSISFRDADTGDLLYLLEPVAPGLLSDEAFGVGLMAPATDLGSVVESGRTVQMYSYYFRTDAGDVELYPGVPQEVLLGGDSFRVILLAGFTSQLLAGSGQCVGPDDRSAIEILRVDPGTAALDPILRPEETLPMPLPTCL